MELSNEQNMWEKQSTCCSFSFFRFALYPSVTPYAFYFFNLSIKPQNYWLNNKRYITSDFQVNIKT